MKPILVPTALVSLLLTAQLGWTENWPQWRGPFLNGVSHETNLPLRWGVETGILKGFDFDGNELWMRNVPRDYGPFGLNWGYASSPLLYQ